MTTRPTAVPTAFDVDDIEDDAPTPEPAWTRRRTPRPPALAQWRPGVAIGALVVVLLALAACRPDLFSSIDPNRAVISETLQGPSGRHWFGTDQNGRDIYSRVVHGARLSLLIGLGASALALVVGSLVGILAASTGRVVGAVVDRVLDSVLSIPGLLMVLLVIAVLGTGTRNSVIGLALVTVPGYARVVRGEVIRIRGSVYLEAAHALGWSRFQVLRRHLVPNALGPVSVLATIGVGSAISTGSSLSFLGLGPQPPAAEWGAMLSTSRTYFAVAWWPAVFPGLAITLTVLAVTVTGQYLQLRVEGRNTR
ncbi:ABC transporter permease [Streptomyces sp. SID3343]|uniref:ABC transporter permease n=1 Tax=Streptomyces sp. SID3343 TaxID=2690260 RepID=UPI00136D321F|nr:ABC transporter permease [Streptomyces sp. SID3343]MYW00286.1 ABC transporter permease subunit [Streptomyces sp. SID3343]